MTAASSTTTAAAAAAKVVFGRRASELKGFGDVTPNELLDGLDFLLSIEETTHNRIFQHAVALCFEGLHLVLGDSPTSLLAMLQHLALLHEGVVLVAGLSILEEGLDAAS